MKTIITGDSHVAAIGRALMELDQDERSTIEAKIGPCRTKMLQNGADFLRPFHERVSGGVRFTNPKTAQAAKEVFPSGIIAPDESRNLYLSCGFHGVSLISSAMWKTYTINPKRVTDRRLISRNAFAAMVKEYNKAVLAFFADLKSAGVSFKVLCSPPLPPNYYDFPRPFTEDECWSLDERYKACFAACLEEIGAQYVLPPSGVYEGRKMKGALSLGRAGDHHGNSDLGKIYLRHLAA